MKTAYTQVRYVRWVLSSMRAAIRQASTRSIAHKHLRTMYTIENMLSTNSLQLNHCSVVSAIGAYETHMMALLIDSNENNTSINQRERYTTTGASVEVALIDCCSAASSLSAPINSLALTLPSSTTSFNERPCCDVVVDEYSHVHE